MLSSVGEVEALSCRQTKITVTRIMKVSGRLMWTLSGTSLHHNVMPLLGLEMSLHLSMMMPFHSWQEEGKLSKLHSLPTHSETGLRQTTELDENASSWRGFLSGSSDDSDVLFRHRLRSIVSQHMAIHLPNNVISADNLQKLLDLADQRSSNH